MTHLTRTVALVGMMGSGKSSVGKRLAARLGVAFRDTDTEIEQVAGCSVAEIFETLGEPAFRDGERKVIARLLQEPPHVLATGGGAFIDHDTRAEIRAQAVSVWLRAPIELLLARVGRRDSRPLLRHGDLRATLEELLHVREPIYAEADVVVDSQDGPHAACVDRILIGLAARGALPS